MTVIVSSLAKKARDTVSTNKIYFDRRSREDKCGHDVSVIANRIVSIYNIPWT